MSWEATKFVADLTATPKGQCLTLAEKFMLLLLANHHNFKKNCAWPSVNTLATQALCSRRYAQEILLSLKEKGAIKIKARERKNGSQTSNAYQICGFKPQRGSESAQKLSAQRQIQTQWRREHPEYVGSPANGKRIYDELRRMGVKGDPTLAEIEAAYQSLRAQGETFDAEKQESDDEGG